MSIYIQAERISFDMKATVDTYMNAWEAKLSRNRRQLTGRDIKFAKLLKHDLKFCKPLTTTQNDQNLPLIKSENSKSHVIVEIKVYKKPYISPAIEIKLFELIWKHYFDVIILVRSAVYFRLPKYYDEVVY